MYSLDLRGKPYEPWRPLKACEPSWTLQAIVINLEPRVWGLGNSAKVPTVPNTNLPARFIGSNYGPSLVFLGLFKVYTD